MGEPSRPEPGLLASLKDVSLVARYHFYRAVRTRSALNLCALFTLCAAGTSIAFRQILKAMEDMTSRTLGVPQTETPGAMFDSLRVQGDLESMLEAMLGNAELVQWALSMPYMTITWVWGGLGLVPFLSAAVGSEAVSPDLASGTVRYEALRTGRLELVGGRFLGLAMLVLVAIALSTLAPFCVAVFWMAEQPAFLQFTSLLAFIPRLWLWSLPFVALGLTCSCLVSNVNWARLGSGVAVVLTWGLWRLVDQVEEGSVWADLVVLLLPQGWIMGMWGSGLDWLFAGVVLFAIAVTYLLPGNWLLGRRDL